jgi:hypothetical protein
VSSFCWGRSWAPKAPWCERDPLVMKRSELENHPLSIGKSS